MRYIIKPTKELGWVAVDEGADESGLVKRIREADIVLSDLDGTDTSSAQGVFFEFLKESSYIFKPKFLLWALSAGAPYAKKGKKAEYGYMQ